MTLDQLIIESQALENIPNKRKKTHFLEYAQKNFQTIYIIGDHDSDFIQNYIIEQYSIDNQIPKFQKKIQQTEILEIVVNDELKPENTYSLTYTQPFLDQTKELEIEYSHKPTNLDDVIKELKKLKS
jgi:hypothetical protein